MNQRWFFCMTLWSVLWLFCGICVSWPVDAVSQWVTSGCKVDPPYWLRAAAAPSRRVPLSGGQLSQRVPQGHQRVYNLQKQGTGPSVWCPLTCRALSCSLHYRSYLDQEACQFFLAAKENRSTAAPGSLEHVRWGIFLFFIFPPAAQGDTQTWRGAGGRAGGAGRAPAPGAGGPELRKVEAQADSQTDAPPEDSRPQEVPVECRDQRIHGSLRQELEWVDEL